MGKTVYSFEVRLDAVQRHLGGISLKALAEEIHCSAGDIQKWRDAYLEHGPDALKPIEHFEHYSSDFKISVIEYMHSTGSSIRKTAAHFNIPSFSSVMKWEKLYNEQGNDAFLVKKPGRGRPVKKRIKETDTSESKESLLKEIKRLRMENEYLKKLNALVQDRENSTRKIK